MDFITPSTGVGIKARNPPSTGLGAAMRPAVNGYD